MTATDREHEIAIWQALGWRTVAEGTHWHVLREDGSLWLGSLEEHKTVGEFEAWAYPSPSTVELHAWLLVDAVVPSRFPRFSLDFTGICWSGLVWRPTGGGSLLPSSAPTRPEAITRAIGRALEWSRRTRRD